MAIRNQMVAMADSGYNPQANARAAQTAVTSTKNSNGFFSKLAGAVNNWANKLVGNNPNAGKSGVSDSSTWAGLINTGTGNNSGSKPTSPSTSGIGASSVSSTNNAVNNIKAGLPAANASTVYTPSTQSTPANRSATPSNSGTLGTNAGTVNRSSSGVITDLPTATQNTNPGTLVGQYLLDQLADIKGINTEQGSSGVAESPETAAGIKEREATNAQAEKEQDAAAGLKALLSKWFYNPNAGKSGLNDKYNFVRPGDAEYIAVTAGGGVPERRAPTIEDRIAEQAAGRQQRAVQQQLEASRQQQLHEEAMRQQYFDDFVNGKFAGDWNAFNRATRGADILNPNAYTGGGIGPVYSSLHPTEVGSAAMTEELTNLANKYFADGGTYSPFGGGTADDVAYTVAAAEDPNNPGTYLSWGNSPLQTTNGQTTDLSGTRTYVAGDPSSYGYATAEGLVPLQGNGLPDNAAISALGALANSGNWVPNGQPAAPESLVQGLATMLANAGVTGESPDNNGGDNGGGGGGAGGGGNSGTYHGGGNVATNNTTGETNDYLYTLPEVSNSVSGALLNRLLPSGYDYNYNARMQSRLGDLQAAEDYYRNSAIPTLQNVYQNQAANTLANYLQAIRANRQSGLTSGANRGAQLASEVQAMQSANKENSENLNNTVGTNLANVLSTLTGKRATAGSDTAGELQPYTTSMDNALSQVLMYYLYGNAAAEVNNGGLRRQNTVNYTAV